MTQSDEHCLGAHRAALRLAKRTGIPVGRADIDTLNQHGILNPAGTYQGHPTYHPADLDTIDAAALRVIVDQRETWLRTSIDERTAARILGTTPTALRQQTALHRINPGRFDRYARADIERLAAHHSISPTPDARHRVRQWAQAMLTPDKAVIIDVETAHLGQAVCEIAIVAAHSGHALVDTLVNPETPIDPTLGRIHGIHDAAVATAPTLTDLHQTIHDALVNRHILAYNSEYDRTALLHDFRAQRLDTILLDNTSSWSCLMQRRMTWLGTTKPLPLGGTHRAKNDCLAARQLLQHLAR